MADFQAYSCDAVTGVQIDRIPVSAFSGKQLMSAGGEGAATIPLDGTFSQTELRALVEPWARLLVLERNGTVQYIGYTQGDSYNRGSNSVTVRLADWWSLAARRGAWNHSAPNVELWKQTVAGSLATQAAAAVTRGRTGPAVPPMGYPITLQGSYPGTSVSRVYYGYHMETVGEVLSDLLAEGLDIFMAPRWLDGGANWQMRAGLNWGTGVTREFYVTADKSNVTEFGEATDGANMTNNARYVGEGSEVDMLVRSNRNLSSTLPLLDRTTQAKNISDVAQLSAMADQDLVSYAAPRSEWSFKVTADTPVDVGDTARLNLADDPWTPDGFYNRRVVGIAVDMSEMKTITVQPTGGV